MLPVGVNVLADFVATLFIIAMTSYTCRCHCEFPVYAQTDSEGEAARQREWRARSRSPRETATSLRVVVDRGTLSWTVLEDNSREDDARMTWMDQCLEEIKNSSGLFRQTFQCACEVFERFPILLCSTVLGRIECMKCGLLQSMIPASLSL